MSEGLGLADVTQERDLLLRIVDIVTSGLDIRALAQGVADLITDATDTDVCFVHVVDRSGGRLVLSGATPPYDRLAGRITLAVGEGISGWVAEHGQAVVITDNKMSDPRYRYIPELEGEQYRSMASVPMVSRPGRLVGVLNVHSRRRREFSAGDVRLLQTIASLVAGAIENADLHREVMAREQAREQFAERIVALQEAERRRLAAEIHDGISQRIVGLAFHLSAALDALPTDPQFAAERIAAARDLAAAALDETRLAIVGLRPPVLDDLGLGPSLESLVRNCPGLEVEIDIEDCRLPDHVETALFRIAQEAVQNVLKHADASHLALRLRCRRDRVVLEVEDDGRGFDTTASTGSATGVSYGLSGMRERAALVDAVLDVRSAPGRGTTVRVSVPLRRRRQAASSSSGE